MKTKFHSYRQVALKMREKQKHYEDSCIESLNTQSPLSKVSIK